MMSRRTRDALLDIRDRVHTARRFAHAKLPTPIMLTPPPPQPWCCCYCHGMYLPDPFIVSHMVPPPPPIHFTQVVPYPVCLHFSLEPSMPLTSSSRDFDIDDMSISSNSSSTLENEHDYIDAEDEKVGSPKFVSNLRSTRYYLSQRR
ncbi:hypothetical protein K501DRAFT_287883, partial [Backusella circina FSU 941]